MDYRAGRAAFVDAAAWWRPEINLAEPGREPIRVNTIETSGNLFELLGVSAALGPGFPAGGPFYSQDNIAVISDRLWRQEFNADPNIVGRAIKVNGGQYTITGVMPATFNFPDDVDLWLRLQWDLTRHSRGAHFMEAIARLQPGVDEEQAARELAAISARLGQENIATNRGWLATPVPLLDDMLGYYRPALYVLLGAVALVLIDRVPERRRPAAGPGNCAEPRDGGAGRARRLAAAAGAADARRKPAARGGRNSRRRLRRRGCC